MLMPSLVALVAPHQHRHWRSRSTSDLGSCCSYRCIGIFLMVRGRWFIRFLILQFHCYITTTKVISSVDLTSCGPKQ